MPSWQEALKRFRPDFCKKSTELPPDLINPTIFTGSGMNYVQSVLTEQNGFRHESGGKVYLTNRLSEAWAAAINRSTRFNDLPVILVVDATNSSFNFGREGIQLDIVSDVVPYGAIKAIYDVSGIRESDLLFEDESALESKGRKIL